MRQIWNSSQTRSALRTSPGKTDRLSRWALALAERSHPNIAATALANKMARVAWAMLRHATNYQTEARGRPNVARARPTRGDHPPRLRASRVMANRSNRRRTSPRMSTGAKSGKPVGSRRANSPSWPDLGWPRSYRGRIYVSSRTSSSERGVLASGERSIYGHLFMFATTPESATKMCRPAIRHGTSLVSHLAEAATGAQNGLLSQISPGIGLSETLKQGGTVWPQ